MPFVKNKEEIGRHLTHTKAKLSPNLFDSEDFLNYVYRKKIGIERDSQSITTLALRASTTDYAFFSPLWEDSFNLGLTSSDLYYTYHLYKLYRTRLPKLKNIIIFFSVCAPGYELIKTSERYRTVAYNFFFQIPYSNKAYIEPKFEKRVLKRCLSLKTPEVDESYDGYESKTYFGVNISAQERFRTHFRENQRYPDQMPWLKSLLKLVVSDNRRLIIVIPPVRSDYKNILPSELILYEKVYGLKTEGLEIISYFDSNKFDDSDFGDVDHFNEQGSIKITTDLQQIFAERLWL